MSTDHHNDDEPRAKKRVTDEEGSVDQNLKKRILKLREKIEKREDDLMAAQGAVEGQIIYHRTVNQFLRRIEPLLRNDDIPGAGEAYTQSVISVIEVPPPPVEINLPPGFEHEKAAELRARYAGQDPDTVLAPLSDIPEPKKKQVRGLREIIESEGKGAEWSVSVEKMNGEELMTFDNRGQETTISNFVRYDFRTLTNAVRVADQFLDDADLGFALDDGNDEWEAM